MASVKSNSNPLISVCIPVFNGENFIEECIESILDQTEDDFEILVIDNCSTDETLNIVDQYNDARIKVIRNSKNIGGIGNFNRCIKLARGEFIVLLPHDDLLLPTALATFREVLESDKEIGTTYSSYFLIDEKGKRTSFVLSDDEDKIMTSNEAFTRFAEGNPIQCTMTRREIYSQIGVWDAECGLVSDWEMWCRIALAGHKVAYIKTPQNCYRVHSNNLTKSWIQKNEYNSEIFKGSKKIFSSIAPHSSFQELRPLTAKWIFGSQYINMTQAMEKGNWVTARRELGLFIRLLRWAGIKEMWPDLRVLLSRTIKKCF